jgi:hypothetical protein
LASLKKIHETCHIESCRDTDDSIKYCTKEDTREDGPWTDGEIPKNGAPKGNKNACIAQKLRDMDPLEAIE